MDFIQEVNISIPSGFTLVVLVWLLGCSIRFKLMKRSISTAVILIAIIFSFVLNYFELYNLAEVLLLLSVLILITRAITKEDTDVLFRKKKRKI